MNRANAPSDELSDLLMEDRRFEPSEEFRRLAVAQDPSIRSRSWDDPVTFWDNAAHALH